MDDPDPGLAIDPRQSGWMTHGEMAPEQAGLTVDILVKNANWRRLGAVEEEIPRLVHSVFTILGYDSSKPLEIGIVLSSDTEVRMLNRAYRGKDMPTNVLSFPMTDPGNGDRIGSRLLGEVVLALETILREAHEARVSPIDHLSHLIAHGILHLLGHDHQTDAEAARMEAEESNILRSLGLRDPYAASDRNNAL